MKKALALILTLIMVLGLMPAAMAAAEPASLQQIGHYAPANDDTDGALGEPTKGTPSEKTLEGGKVIISKTIAGTETENEFEITLEVKTTETIENVSSAPDAAVVLVIDVSGSMDEDDRLSSAKAAAQAFINSFAKDAGNAQRKVAIVKFSGDYYIDGAKTVQGWTEASSLVKTDGQQCAAIENLSAGGGTNLHAGLLLAKNLLNDSSVKDIENKSIVLLSDGKPTFFVDGNEANSQSIDVICKDGNSMGGDGRNTSHNTHTKVETLMQSDDLKGINKYAVYIGDEDIECTKIISCRLDKPTSDWLRSDCGFSTYSVKDLTSLTGIFENIVKSILIKAQAWMVTDPMGTNIQFAGFTNCDSNATNEDNGTISWDLKKDNKYTTDTQGTTTTRTYTCKYKVKLDTLAQGFEANKEYPTNGITTLTYVIEKEGQTVTEADLKTAYFNVPSVKGFAGNLTFTKVDADKKPLAGAEFRLYKDGWERTATSDTDGQVKFENIPSGHTYTLTETKTPEGYQGLDGTYTVEVAYGTAVLKKDKKDVIPEQGHLYVVNKRDKPTTGSLTITKVFGEGSALNANNWPQDKQLTFTIVNEDGTPVGTVTLPKNGQWTDTVQLAPGTYTVTESDADVTGYGLTVSNTGTTTTTNGKTGTVTVTAGTTPATITFTNTYTLKTVNIPVTKVWNDNENEHPSVTVKLLADGKEVAGKTLTLGATATTGGAQWTGTFMDLPKYNAEGKEIEYTVQEDPVPEGYKSEVTGTVENGFTITNTKLAEGKTVVTVQKTWEAPDGTIFPEVKVEVFKGNEVVDTITLNKDNGWMDSSKELDQYPNGATVGTDPINYTVQEVVLEGYIASEPVYDETGKVWKITNKIEKQYTVKLVKIVEGYEGSLSEVEVTVENKEGTYKKTHKVPVNDPIEIQVPAGTYTVTENTTGIQVPGYTLNTTYAPNNEFTVPADTADTADAVGIAATVTVTNTYTKNSPTPTPTPTPAHHHRPDPVPPIVIPPKTGDMTIWQSILNFLGIR